MFPTDNWTRTALKTIKQEEAVSRSRFIDCPVCKNRTLKLKRVVHVGRCKSCSESYKIIVVYMKIASKEKKLSLTKPSTSALETGPKTTPESTLPSWQMPSDTSLFGSSNENYSALSDTSFSYIPSEEGKEPESTSGH